MLPFRFGVREAVVVAVSVIGPMIPLPLLKLSGSDLIKRVAQVLLDFPL